MDRSAENLHAEHGWRWLKSKGYAIRVVDDPYLLLRNSANKRWKELPAMIAINDTITLPTRRRKQRNRPRKSKRYHEVERQHNRMSSEERFRRFSPERFWTREKARRKRINTDKRKRLGL